MSTTEARPKSVPHEARPAPMPPPPPHAEDEIPRDLKRPHPLLVIAMLLMFAAALVGLFFAGWQPRKAERAQAESDAAEQGRAAPIVSVMVPHMAGVTHEIVLPCDIRPNQETLIYPRASGYLKKLYVDIQDKVEAGQLLAEIDAPEIDAELDRSKAAQVQAEANVGKAQADLDLAQRTLDRYDVVNTSVTKQEKDEKRAARDDAAAALEQAKANVVAAKADVQRLAVLQSFEKVTAPFSGTITARNFDIGTLLSAGTQTPGHELFRLTQANVLRVFVNVPQIEAPSVKIGQDATLQVRNYPGRTFKGQVARAADALDTNTRTMSFELHFPNPKGELYAGMYGEASLTITDAAPTILIPSSALVFNAAGTQVALVQDGKVHFQKVAIGRDMGTELEITEGLKTDDHVIVNPSERLAEGVAVETAGGKPQMTGR